MNFILICYFFNFKFLVIFAIDVYFIFLKNFFLTRYLVMFQGKISAEWLPIELLSFKILIPEPGVYLFILCSDLSKIYLISSSLKLQEFKRVFPFVAAPIPITGLFLIINSRIFWIVIKTFFLNRLNSERDIFLYFILSFFFFYANTLKDPDI